MWQWSSTEPRATGSGGAEALLLYGVSAGDWANNSVAVGRVAPHCGNASSFGRAGRFCDYVFAMRIVPTQGDRPHKSDDAGTATMRAVGPRPEDHSRSMATATKRWGVNIHWVECHAHAPCPANLGPSGGPMPGEPEQLGAKHRRPFSQQPKPPVLGRSFC